MDRIKNNKIIPVSGNIRMISNTKIKLFYAALCIAAVIIGAAGLYKLFPKTPKTVILI